MHTFGFLDSGVVNVAPNAPSYIFAPGTPGIGTLAVAINNNNDFAMTLTLGAWTDAVHFSWVTASPVVIAPRSSANVTARFSGTAGTTATATATVGWVVAGGGNGNVTANADHESGA